MNRTRLLRVAFVFFCIWRPLVSGASAQTPAEIPPEDNIPAHGLQSQAARPVVEVPIRNQQSGGGERTFLATLGDNVRFTVDLSTRIALTDEGEVSTQNVVGLDTHKVLTSDRGDWATLVMQGYLTRIDNTTSHPPFFDDADDAEFVYRILNVNITRFGRGKFNVRLGHFEIPFGLEQVINTNGTLRDFMHGQNLGVKADWGVGVNGSWPQGEYEVTWSRGTGNTIFATGNPFIVAGRVGTPGSRNLVLGTSFFRGRVWNPKATGQWADGVSATSGQASDLEPRIDEIVAAGLVERSRVGADVQWYRGLYGVLAEVAYGGDAGSGGWGRQSVLNLFVEVNRSNSDERVSAYLQTRVLSRDHPLGWNRSVTGALGLRFAVDNHWAASSELVHAVPPGGQPHRTTLRSQLRYRF